MILWMHYAYVSTLNRATFWNMLLWQNANLNRREETIKVQGQYQLSFEVKLKRNIIYFTLMSWIDNPVCLFLSMFVSSIKIEFFYNSHFDSFVIQVHPNYTLIQMEHFYLQIYRKETTVYVLLKNKRSHMYMFRMQNKSQPVNAFKICMCLVYSKTSFIRKKILRFSIQSYIIWDTWRNFMATCTILFYFCSKN